MNWQEPSIESSPTPFVVPPLGGFSAGWGLGRWSLVAGVPLLGLAAALWAWAVLSVPTVYEEELEASLEDSAAPDTRAPAAAQPVPVPLPGGLDPRWLSGRARLVVSLRLAALAEQPEMERAVATFEHLWRPSVARVLESFKLLPRNVRKITWASADLTAWHDRAVVVLEFEQGQDAGALTGLGDPLDWQVAGKPCRRMKAGWPHPFVVLDERTVISGPEDLLRELSDRTEPQFQSAAIGHLIKSASPEADFVVLLDLIAAREAGWRLPSALWDIWPAGRPAWHTLWETPQGLGFAVRRSNPGQSELALVCEGESAAMKVRDALGQFVPAARIALEANAATLTQRLQAGRVTAREADQYEVLLKQGHAALSAAKWEIVEQTVVLRIDWGQHLPATTAAALESERLIRADWLEAGLAADQSNHGRLVKSLGGYVKAEKQFPVGAGGGSLLPPDTRLSWIASMLPYFDHRDWHRELQFGYSWNSAQNRPVTQRRLEAVMNPTLGPASTEAGFPVTHYVGVAGVGADAAELKAGDPRAGLFGSSRTVRPEDLARGAGNTLATLGASQQLGPWAAGGKATVRALTKRPYVHGPDGFGSGQPDGMLAGMADGAVRFISKNVDPEVLEQLAAVRGGPATVAALGPDVGHVSNVPKPGEHVGNVLHDGPRPEPKAAEAAPTGKAAPPVPRGEAPKIAAKSMSAAPAERSVMAGNEPRMAEDDESDDDATTLPGLDDAEPAKVDVQARLADRIPEIHFPAVPMLDAVRLMSQMSTVPVSFDLDWVQAVGANLRDRVTVRLAGATTGEVVEALVAGRGLTCEAAGDQLLITAPSKKRNAQRAQKYGVADLVDKDPATGGQLAAWVRALVSPESWREAGGQGSIQLADGALTITQSELVHAQVRDFFDRLRLARGKSPQGRPSDPKEPRPTRFDLARAKLRQPITLSFPDPTPLAGIARELERASQTTVLFDGPAMSAAGVSRQRKAVLSVHGRPLSEALVSVLDPLGLTYRIVDAGAFEITTRKAAAARLELEIYPVAAILAKPTTPEALMEQVKAQVAGATWNDAGGPGVMLFDKASRCLLVLQSQPVQVKVQLLLGRL